MIAEERNYFEIIHLLEYWFQIPRIRQVIKIRDILREQKIALNVAQLQLAKGNINMLIGNPGIDERLCLGGKMHFTCLSIFVAQQSLDDVHHALLLGSDPNVTVVFQDSQNRISKISCLQIAEFFLQGLLWNSVAQEIYDILKQHRAMVVKKEFGIFQNDPIMNRGMYALSVGLPNIYPEGVKPITEISQPAIMYLPCQYVKIALEMGADPNLPLIYKENRSYAADKACEDNQVDNLRFLVLAGAQLRHLLPNLTRSAIWPGESLHCLEYLLQEFPDFEIPMESIHVLVQRYPSMKKDYRDIPKYFKLTETIFTLRPKTKLYTVTDGDKKMCLAEWYQMKKSECKEYCETNLLAVDRKNRFLNDVFWGKENQNPISGQWINADTIIKNGTFIDELIDVKNVSVSLLLSCMHNTFSCQPIELQKLGGKISHCLLGWEMCELPSWLQKDMLQLWNSNGIISSGLFNHRCLAWNLIKTRITENGELEYFGCLQSIVKACVSSGPLEVMFNKKLNLF
jgi:hypothetical protein